MVNLHFPMVQIMISFPNIPSPKTRSVDLFCFIVLMFTSMRIFVSWQSTKYTATFSLNFWTFQQPRHLSERKLRLSSNQIFHEWWLYQIKSVFHKWWQRMTLPKISKKWMLWSVTKNQRWTVSDSVANPSPCVVGHVTVEQSVHSRSHRARENEILYRLRVTGCWVRCSEE